jgi:mercuric ion transport protein
MHPLPNKAAAPAACNCKHKSGKAFVRWTTAGGILAALGICAACCLLPFALIAVGVAGALITFLDAARPYKWYFVAATIALLAYGFFVVYWKSKGRCSHCDPGAGVKFGLWAALILSVSGVVFEYLEPLFG